MEEKPVSNLLIVREDLNQVLRSSEPVQRFITASMEVKVVPQQEFIPFSAGTIALTNVLLIMTSQVQALACGHAASQMRLDTY